MNEWYIAGLTVAAAVMFLCLVLVFVERRKSKALIKNLNSMLDSALEDTFEENRFDESLLSAVESRMNRYLTTSVVSSRNLATEKEKIKELLSDISHQTKTPIANILLYAQLLEEKALDEESAACVAALRGQTEKLSSLVASLVKLSRLEVGVFTLNPVYNGVNHMIEEAVAQFVRAADQKGIKLTVEETGAYAVFDHKWTVEALCNLLDNAIKYTRKGGHIGISVKEYDLFCRIDVADTGIGISEAEQAKVFARFYRSPSVSEEEGVGIGLYLTREILRGQGGYIKVASNLGEGAVFSMFLPLTADSRNN